MKSLLSILLASIFIYGCKDKPEPDVASLLIGEWKLIKYKQENQSWKDSTGLGYNFINDTLVNTIIGPHECNRKYKLTESAEDHLKQVIFPTYENTCFFPIWNTLDIVSISKQQMQITYLDEIAGMVVWKYEIYMKD